MPTNTPPASQPTVAVSPPNGVVSGLTEWTVTMLVSFEVRGHHRQRPRLQQCGPSSHECREGPAMAKFVRSKSSASRRWCANAAPHDHRPGAAPWWGSSTRPKRIDGDDHEEINRLVDGHLGSCPAAA